LLEYNSKFVTFFFRTYQYFELFPYHQVSSTPPRNIRFSLNLVRVDAAILSLYDWGFLLCGTRSLKGLCLWNAVLVAGAPPPTISHLLLPFSPKERTRVLPLPVM